MSDQAASSSSYGTTSAASSLELGEYSGRVSVSGSDKRPPPELRHRKHQSATNSNTHSSSSSGGGGSSHHHYSGGSPGASGGGAIATATRPKPPKPKKRKKKRRWRWIIGKPRDLTMEQEQVFMTMKLRKLNRALTGTKTKKNRFDFLALTAFFVLAFGVVSYTTYTESAAEEQALEEETGSNRRIIVLDLTEIIIIMFYIFVVSLVTSVFRESKFITLLYWMFVYLPLAAMIVAFILDDHGDWGGFIGRNPVVAILLITAELFVLTAFLTLYKIYPKIVQSKWFRRKKRAGTFWRVKVISDWTMTYVGSWGRRFSCKYDGETNQDGLPHGYGRWLDDSYSGEVLTGTWINGVPVAPFASRQFGTGDAFKAVRIGYIMASDDEFSTTKFWPSNDKPPRIGMCSVECSISGSFYNELPLATHLSGPHWMDEHQHSVATLCRQLTHIDDEEERDHQIVQIKASDPRGIQVRGHVYGATGESFHPGISAVVVQVDQDTPENDEEGDDENDGGEIDDTEQGGSGGDGDGPGSGGGGSGTRRAYSMGHAFRGSGRGGASHHQLGGGGGVANIEAMTPSRIITPRRTSLNFMPRAARHNFMSERVIVCDESDSGEEESERIAASTHSLELQTVLEVEENESQNMSRSDHTNNINNVTVSLKEESTTSETTTKKESSPEIVPELPTLRRVATHSGILLNFRSSHNKANTETANNNNNNNNSSGGGNNNNAPSGHNSGSYLNLFSTGTGLFANSATASALLGYGTTHTNADLNNNNNNDNNNNNTTAGETLPMSEMTTTMTVEPFRMANASLRVQDWIPAPHKDALIFFPGYKVPLKQSLEALGQFIAMTRLDSRVYPIIYGWPCGQRFTYHCASLCSATEKNRENLLSLLKGLQAAGIRNVHFMSHSMGAQTMLGAFDDQEDGSRSPLSQLFQLDPDFVADEEQQQDESGGSYSYHTSSHHRCSLDRSLMICRTVTMLNPDFPLEAFVDRSFQSVRRVCSTVTIIGDRHDLALYLSQYMNGLSRYFGYQQPEVLQPKANRDLGTYTEREVYQGKHRFRQEVIGFSIESLYFPDNFDRTGQNDSLLFKIRAPVIVSTDEEPVADRAWLDLDVIDTTGLDTNIAGIRHSGFNLNPILLKDLEELISTSRRAVNRATLLYRDGNLFSYCHAPSYVAM